MTFEEQIRERAYHIWQAGGMADGQAHEHWVSAEQAVRGASEPEVILTKAAPHKTKAAAKPATAKSAAKAAKPAAGKTPRASKAKKAELSASA